MRQFIAIGTLVALAGCAGTPVNKYIEADLPQPNASLITRVGNTLEMNVTVPSCGENCVVSGEWQASGEVAKSLLAEKVGGALFRQVSVTNVPAGTKGTVKINAKNSAGVVRLEKTVEVSSPQVEARTQAEVFRGFVPSRGAPTVFRSAEQCRQVAFAGAFDYYVPMKKARHPVAPADGKTRTLAKLEAFYCLEMDTTAGKWWVVADRRRDDYIWQDGKIVGHSKCLNRVYNSFPLVQPDSPAGADAKTFVPVLSQGSWTRQNFISQEKVSSIDWGRTFGAAVLIGAVVCLVGKVWICEPDKPNPTNIPGGPGVTTGGNPLVQTLP